VLSTFRGRSSRDNKTFQSQLRCSGDPVKDDDTHYRIKVEIPQEIAASDYKIAWVNVAADNFVGHQYSDLPNLAPVTIIDPKQVEFSPIKKLEVK
jgi:hypothetical protein